MYLSDLKLINFRNYARQKLSFHPRTNIFTGLNAQGKTNLLEAIYYLTVSRSFRTGQEADLLRIGSSYFCLEGTFRNDEERSHVDLRYRLSHRLGITVNGKALKRTDYIYRHPIVVFSPDDLLLVKEGPSKRRRFLDMEGSRLKPLYYRRLRDYHRVLQQRNRVLKEKRGSRSINHSLLEPWDQALVNIGSAIMKERINLLKALENRAQSHFAALTGEKESLSLHYRSTVGFDGDFTSIEGAFRKQLKDVYGSELRRGATLIGPHLDDFAVMINDRDARRYGSQGQQRSVVLALKIGEVDLFKRIDGGDTILLLDDILSEFDEKRSNHLLQFLSNREGQSFITTASPLWANEKRWPGQVKIYSISRGEVKIV